MNPINHIANRVIPMANNNFRLVKSDYTTDDIIDLIIKSHKRSLNDTKELVKSITGRDVKEFTRNLYNLVKSNVAYKLDPAEAQFVKSPAQVWQDKFSDCKSYSIFFGTALHNAGIPFKYRFVSFTGSKTPTHVYVIVPLSSKTYITLDAVMPGYNREKPFTFKKDIDMKGLYFVSGIGQIKKKPVPVSFDLMGKDIADLTSGELDLLIARDQIETRKQISENMRGIGNLRAEQYQDKLDVIDDALEVINDYKVGLIDDPEEELTEIATAAINGLYSTSRVLMGIGDIGARKQVRKQKKAARKDARQDKRAAKKTAKTQKKQIKKTVPKSQRKEALQQVKQTKKAAVKQAKSVIDAHRTKTGKFLQKAGKAAAKGVKAVTKVVTAPVRLVAKGALEIYLPKAAPYFLYLFINDKNVIAKLPAKVRDKRKKAEGIANFIVNGIGMKRSHVMGILRNGILKRFGKTPEAVIAEQMKGTLAGIGAIGEVLSAVLWLINKISSLVKGKKAPKVDANDMPESSDWDEVTKQKTFAADQQKQTLTNLNILGKKSGKNQRLTSKIEKLKEKALKNPKKARALSRVNERLDKLTTGKTKVTAGNMENVLNTLSAFIDKEPEDTTTANAQQLMHDIKTQPENTNPLADDSEFNEFESGGRSIWNSLDF